MTEKTETSEEEAGGTEEVQRCVMQQLLEIDKYLDKAWTLTIDLELPGNKGEYYRGQLCKAFKEASGLRMSLETQFAA